jgi:gliding motility-associated-like protein
MKRFLTVTFLLIVFLISMGTKVNASHYMGGEITWECLANGKYIFTLKAYRECAGITYGNTQTITSNSPAGSISCTLLQGWPKDISPVCNNNPTFPHITCQGATTPNAGAVSEYIWKSGEIQLSGVPPITGWMFQWGSCCRNPSTNIVNANSKSWKLRAIMYPYGTQNMYPCFDNSPTFAEVPRTVICTGYPFTYNHNAFDKELDSLHYEWGQPWQGTNQPLTPYAGGYSYLSPLPGTAQNVNNVPAVVNPLTGEISFTSFTTGAFVTSTKVTAYKCGIKVAEIWRDMQIVLLACGSNSPPNVTPPFANGTSYLDTIFAGDNICFNLSATDFQFLPNGSPQTLNIEASGMQLGNYVAPSGGNPSTLSSTTGCVNPPCATLTPAPGPNNPLQAQFGVQTQFCWQTDCGHLATNTGCGNTSNVYNFVIKVQDDFCPAPAINISTVTIVVLPKPTLPSPPIQCLEVATNGDVTLKWSPVIDTMATFDSYHIFTSTNPAGPFTVLDSIYNININQFTHTGAGANTQPVYYFIRTRAGCPNHQLFSPTPDTVSTIFVTVTNPGNNGTALVDWNPIRTDTLPGSTGIYDIHRSFLNTPFSHLGSTTAFNYVDSVTLCEETLNFKVEIADTAWYDSTGAYGVCYSVSSIDGDLFEDKIAPAIPNIDSVSVNPITGNVDMSWDLSPAKDDTAYIVYMYNGTTWSPIDTVWGRYNTTYTDVNNNPCIPGSYNIYRVAAMDSCENTSLMSAPHNTMNLVAVKDICDDKITLTWNHYNNFNGGLLGYNVYSSENGGTITLLGTNVPTDTVFEHLGLNNGSQYTYIIQAVSNNGVTSSSCVVSQVANKPNQPQFIYIRSASVLAGNDGVVLTIHTDTAGKVSSYTIERNGDGTWNPIGTLPPNYTNPTQTYVDGTALVTQKSYRYRVIVTDSCGVDVLTSDIARTALLQVDAESNLTNVLDWTDYVGYLGQPTSYAIYRKVDGTWDPLPVAVVPGTQTNYIDDVESLDYTNGIFFYYVMALEGTAIPNPFGFADSARSNTMRALQNPRVYVPTAFSPSSNVTENRTVYPYGVFINSNDYMFQIYNRWGDLLFNSTTINEAWDGMVEGKEAPQGVYTYLVRFTTSEGLQYEKRGTITLIR